MFIKIFNFFWKTCLLFLIISIVSVLIFRFVRVPFTPLMITRCFEQVWSKKEITLKHHWVPLKNISSNLQLAVVCSEDQNYIKHFGFDLDAIKQAIKENEVGKRIRGGSTITQQTAKNVFLWQGKSYLRKVLEAWFTLLIEVLWSKERIMEVYLNSIEMGNGIYGAEAASKYWFNKSAKNLTKDNAASIAAILPSPLKYKAYPTTQYIQKRKEWIKKQMNYLGNKLNYN
ncbi:MAG: monofunctional biosynthetic peptidoglycan transglycosylase [Bacteroidota bacterium]